MFGGWWADMDYFLLQPTPPTPPWGKEWLLATEYERRESGYQKAESGVLTLGADLVSVNLGIMWARRGSPLLQEAERKAIALWQDRQKVWTGRRTQRGYQENQRMIQDEFARTQKAALLAPIMTSPIPRWNTKWRT